MSLNESVRFAKQLLKPVMLPIILPIISFSRRLLQIQMPTVDWSKVISYGIAMSPTLHAVVVRQYWNKTKETHSRMDDETFTFLAERLYGLLGSNPRGLLLDYGAGSGQIGEKLSARGLAVEYAEFAEHFIAEIAAKGLPVYHAFDIPKCRFDYILSNGVVFYIHPRKLIKELKRLMAALKPGGLLILADLPTIQLSHRLCPTANIRKLWDRTKVYQPYMGGFFIDEVGLRALFPAVTVIDSWAYYRRHFILRKS